MTLQNIDTFKIYEMRKFCKNNSIEVSGDRRRRSTYIIAIIVYFVTVKGEKYYDPVIEQCAYDGAFYDRRDMEFIGEGFFAKPGAIPVYENEHNYYLAKEMESEL